MQGDEPADNSFQRSDSSPPIRNEDAHARAQLRSQMLQEIQAQQTELLRQARCMLWSARVEGEPEWRLHPTERAYLRWHPEISDETAAQKIWPLQIQPGHSYMDAFYHSHPQEDQERMNRTMRHALLNDLPHYDQEFRCTDRHGELHWIHEEVTIESLGLNRWRLFGVCVDITAAKRLEHDLQAAKVSAERAKTIAERASTAKDRFIAMVSHELRTPLTPALAALSMLRRDPRLPVDVRGDLEIVSRNIDLEVRLIDDLLDVSRNTAGKLHLDMQPTDVAQVIREAADVVKEALQDKQQTLSIDLSNAPYPALADAHRLRQLFWNLLRNAIKFSPEHAAIGIRASAVQPCDGKDGQLDVLVIDHGSGIAKDMLPRLFNAFEQEEKARSFGGLGIGLSICKAVADAHGGTIRVTSAGHGQGSTFTVQLPLVDAQIAPLHSAVAPASVEPRSDSAVRILLVEDHADTVRLMARFLKNSGYEVTPTSTISAALEAASEHSFDLVVSDVGLPDGSGTDLMRQLHTQHRLPRGIALSGYGTAEDIQRSREAGFAEHLVKPINVKELLAAIERVMKTSPRRD